MNREEAIEVYHGLINTKIKEAFEFFAPELAGSEDERIRRVIYKLMLGMREEIFTSQDEIVTKEKVLSWLERQKEPTDPEEQMNHPLYLEGFDTGREVQRVLDEQKPNYCHYGATPSKERCSVCSANCSTRVIDEQKPVENTCGTCCDDERFEIIAQAKKDIIEKTNIAENELSMELPLLDGILLRVWQVGWLNRKPVEWSEEDKQWLSEVYFAIDHSMYSEVERQAMKEYIDFLRSQSKPKQEWSEEDEQTINSACLWLGEYAGYIGSKNYGKSSMLFSLIGELKSLRPRWKPSEEQMISWLEKQKEQKSVDEKSVDEVGKSVRKKWAIDFIRFLDEHRYDGKMCVSNGECMDIENAFISADWEKLIRYYNKYTQKPAEWSEEDEEKLNQIDSLLWLLDDYVGDDCSLGQEKTDSIRSEIQNVLSPWLKSLRPSWKPSEVCYGAKGDPDPAGVWKPSEKQIEALEYVIRDYREDSCNATANYLQEILDHLKNV